jgi:hypothetical protein
MTPLDDAVVDVLAVSPVTEVFNRDTRRCIAGVHRFEWGRPVVMFEHYASREFGQV